MARAVEALQEGSYAEQFGSATSTVVVLGANQTLRGLEPQTGKTRWSVPVAGLEPLGGTKKLVFLGTPRTEGFPDPNRTSIVRAIDRDSGSKRWEFTLPNGSDIRGLALADGTTVVVLAASRQLTPLGDPIALDTATGRERWRMSATFQSGPFAAGATVAWFSATGHLVGYDAATGDPKWENSELPIGSLVASNTQFFMNVFISDVEPTGLTAVDATDRTDRLEDRIARSNERRRPRHSDQLALQDWRQPARSNSH